MATLATAQALASAPAKDVTTGVFSIVQTLEIDTDTLVNVSTGATTTAVAQNDVVQLVRVPNGVTVLDGYIAYDALGGSTTVDIGDGDNDDLWISAVDTSSAGVTRFGEAGLIIPKTYAANDTVDATFEGGNPSGTLTLVLFCTSDGVDLT